jgi:hypothetical protein
VSEFFATNAPDPLHLNQNSCIAGVLNCFATTRNSVRNGPNRCHYHTNSLNKVASEFFATNAVDPLHLTQNSCFRAFWTIFLLHERRCKIGCTLKFAKMKLRRNFSQRTHPIRSIGPKTYVLVHFKLFCCCPIVRAKSTELVPLTHKFVKQSCVGICRNERTRSTPFDAKLKF